MFVVLHYAETGKAVAVNSRTIRAFDDGSAASTPVHGARVVFSADHAILVKETPFEIMAKVPGDQLPCDANLAQTLGATNS